MKARVWTSKKTLNNYRLTPAVIQFVMKPLGRFFQFTEAIDVNKYFMDIDKIQRIPLAFVVK